MSGIVVATTPDISPELNAERNEEVRELAVDQFDDDDDVSKYSKLLFKQMAPEKIREAFRIGSRDMLKTAIDDYHLLGLLKDEDVIKIAENTQNDIEYFIDTLQRACSKRNIKDIKSTMGFIRQRGLDKYLRKELQDADRLLEELQELELKMPILAMDKRTMAEVRSYAKVSKLVHRVMQAALLLLGEDEGVTAKWTNCQRLCNPDGPKGMNRRLMQFEPEGIHPYISARAETILKGITLFNIQKASPGVATFYVWAMGVLQSSKAVAEANEETSVPDDDAVQSTTSTPRPTNPSKPESLVSIIQKEREIFAEMQGVNLPSKNKNQQSRSYYKLL